MAARKPKSKSSELMASLKTFALGLPGAWPDNPWGDSVVKVGKKIFVFLGDSRGRVDGHGEGPRITRPRDELRGCACRPGTGSARRAG